MPEEPTPEAETPHKAIERWVRSVNVRPTDYDRFRGDVDQDEGRLFGGLVLAQCVVAAGRTTDRGSIHSMHAYFLRAGAPKEPIDYDIKRVREGRNFFTRRVTAIQAGHTIFEASVSFVMPEEGIEHQKPMPDAPEPEGLPSWWESMREGFPPEMQEQASRRGPGRRGWPQPIDIRGVRGGPSALKETGLPHRTVWAKPLAMLPEDPILHAAAIAYTSDSGLIATVASAYGMWAPGGSSASLDHSIWWHHPPRFDDWLLYTSESPAGHAGRALMFGHMYSRDGVLRTSVAQEGLFRRPTSRSV
jgi:acyl-CoA thioesterase-2